MTRDYLTVKVWDLNMENRPIETYQVQTTLHPCEYHTLPLWASSQPLPTKAYHNTEKLKWYIPWEPQDLRGGAYGGART